MCFSDVLNSMGLREHKFGWGGIVDLGGVWGRDKYGSENFVRKSERTYKNKEKQTMSFSHS